jgi:hypothetical protein
LKSVVNDTEHSDLLYTVARIGRYETGQAYEHGDFAEHLGDEDPQLLREHILEGVRADEFPDRPSRSNAFFAWKSIADARRWLKERADLSAHGIYVIRPGPDSVVFEGDFGWLALTAASIEEWDARSFGYWSGEARFAEARWEVVIAGPITVLDKITANDAR